MKNEHFYMIFLEGGNAPTFAHETLDSAITEAKRLAKLTGKKAYILESVKSVQLHEFDIEDINMPF